MPADRHWSVTFLFSLIFLFVIVMVSGCSRQTVNEQFIIAPTDIVEEHQPDPESHWEEFVAIAEIECRNDPDVSLDFQTLHTYYEKRIGVMVIGWRDSDYLVDMYKYDTESDDWIPGPVQLNESGESIDTDLASREWGVPQEVLDEWIADAHESVRKRYGADERVPNTPDDTRV